jgi:hypothetical protein
MYFVVIIAKYQFLRKLPPLSTNCWGAKRVNGQELQNWKRTDLYEYINQLGEEGWELVGYSADRFANQYMALKRPKQ